MKPSQLLFASAIALGLVGSMGRKALLQPAPPSPDLPSFENNPLQTPPSNPFPPRDEGSSSPALPALNNAALLDVASNVVISRFEGMSCAELAAGPLQPLNGQTDDTSQGMIQAKAFELLQQNASIRRDFLDRVAPAIANKMFDCNIIP